MSTSTVGFTRENAVLVSENMAFRSRLNSLQDQSKTIATFIIQPL